MTPAFDWAEAERVIARIAELADAFGEGAGVGGTEIAGLLVSYLAEHPRDIEPLLRFGVFELPEGWLERGALTWTTKDGRIVRPEQARRARIIKRMERGK